MNGNADPFDWYWGMPLVTRLYFTAAAITTALCALDIVTPYDLYYNAHSIAKGEVWRLLTTFLFFGSFGIDFLFHMYFMTRYCRSLEEGSFRNQPADYLFCLMIGMALILACAPFLEMSFYGSSLTFMLVYLWGRRNPGMQINLLGLLAFSAPYLPWVLLGFSTLLGHDVSSDLLGIAVGHVYYFFADVFPALASARGWGCRRVIVTPWILHRLFGTHAHAAPEFYVEHAPLPAVAPAARDQPADADAPGAAAAAVGPAGGGDEADRIVPAPEVEQRG